MGRNWRPCLLKPKMQKQSYFKKQKALIDSMLDKILPKNNQRPVVIHKAMRYSVFPGGKRFRPLLCLEVNKAVGGNGKLALPFAAAIELIHCYSLIHDDLPSMDNADLRRGKPSCHKKFGQAIAILAGDALLTLSFKLMSKAGDNTGAVKAIEEIADAIGTNGMIGGQAVDIEKKKRTTNNMKYINTHKTGALIAVSAKVGAILGTDKKRFIDTMFRFGQDIGHAFQITDDVKDNEGYAKLVGQKKAKEETMHLIENAKAHLNIFGKKPVGLCKLADLIINR